MSRRPLIMAHRGASHEATENTLIAFSFAWAQQADAIEGDFRLTADGHVACHHDEAFGRVFPGEHRIDATAYAVLRDASAGRLPSAGDVLRCVPRGKGAFLELKTGPEIIEPLAAAIVAGPVALPRLTVMSFFPDTVRAARHRFPTARVNWLVPLDATSSRLDIADQAHQMGVNGIGLSASARIDEHFLRPFFAAGLDVHVWTVDDPGEARRYAELGMASITTNRPGYLRRALAAQNDPAAPDQRR